MKRLVLITVTVIVTSVPALARGGNSKFPDPTAYDYSREHRPGYKKDYCVDAVGNHMYCPAQARGTVGGFSALYSGRQ